MKTRLVAAFAISMVALTSCQKAGNSSSTTLVASTTTPTVGQTVTFTLSSSQNASKWTVSPSAGATKTYSVTTNAVNYITFTQAGTYTVGVSTKAIAYDSTSQSLDSCFNHAGGGNCHAGVDSAAVVVQVKN
jgi:plastocyanin